jgi:hypothetical protein
MRRFLPGLLLSLVLAGAAIAGNRFPAMYNAVGTTVTLTANFFAGGGSITPINANIRWSQANGTAGKTFIVTPSTNGRSCTVTISGGGTGQVDVTCDYTNGDGTHASVTVTVCFGQAAVDQVNLSATG